jgi:PAS domain S-box-containing protein
MDAPVTSLPHSAFTLQAVIRQLPDRVIIKDLNSTFITCNQCFADDVGMAIESVTGKTDYDFFPAELAAAYQADDRKVILSGQPIRMEEPYMLHGQPHWLETSKSPIFDADGQCIGLTAIFKDITQQKQDQAEMQRRAWALQANSRTNQALVQASEERSCCRPCAMPLWQTSVIRWP